MLKISADQSTTSGIFTIETLDALMAVTNPEESPYRFLKNAIRIYIDDDVKCLYCSFPPGTNFTFEYVPETPVKRIARGNH